MDLPPFFLKTRGLINSDGHIYLNIYNNTVQPMYLRLYVDGLIICLSQDKLDKLVDKLKKEFQITTMIPKHNVGL